METLLSSRWPLAAALIPALVDWYAVARSDKRLEYVFKPATMVVLVAVLFALLRGGVANDGWQAGWFLVGFVLSLGGDIFLMLPAQRFFLPGLISFLLGHVAYIAGLNPTLPPAQPGLLVLLVAIALIGGALFREIASGLRAHGHHRLLAPVAVYSVVISLMLWSAWATLLRPDWSDARRLIVIAGATLFFVSDSILAWDRFVRPFSFARLATMVTYHLGQLALAASIFG